MDDSTVPSVPGLATGRVPRRYGMLSTFPPTRCGIASFSDGLANAILSAGGEDDVVRCRVQSSVDRRLADGEASDVARRSPDHFADILNPTDVVIAQHEFGLYAGVDGCGIIDILNQITAPTIAVAHTVPGQPTRGQRSVLESLCDIVDAVVVMTESACERLKEGFDVDSSKIVRIPHGAATRMNAYQERGPVMRYQPRLLTWGLLGPGKGLEWAIDAVAELRDLRPRPRYLISGVTHPNVLANSSDEYRRMLMARAATSPAAGSVVFENRYRDPASLLHLVNSADLVVLPYDSMDQVTSGVLVDAIGCGRPVVATAFPHAVELLGSGAGTIVPQRDPYALARAIRTVLTDADLAKAMAAEARRIAAEHSWPSVAARYCALAATVMSSRHSVSP